MEQAASQKPKCGHLLEYPNALRAMARAAEHGASKHGVRDWPNDPPEEHIHALVRHMLEIGYDGTGVDKESLQAHLAHVMLRAAMAYEVLFSTPMEPDLEKQWER